MYCLTLFVGAKHMSMPLCNRNELLAYFDIFQFALVDMTHSNIVHPHLCHYSS